MIFVCNLLILIKKDKEAQLVHEKVFLQKKKGTTIVELGSW